MWTFIYLYFTEQDCTHLLLYYEYFTNYIIDNGNCTALKREVEADESSPQSYRYHMMQKSELLVLLSGF